MLNKYPLWKNLLILVILAVGALYAAPNLYPDDYAIQISGAQSTTNLDSGTLNRATQALKKAHITFREPKLGKDNATIRFDSAEDQLKAKSVVQDALGDKYLVALNLAATTPKWLRAVGAEPMKLGLDLRGGVHFLMEVDMNAAIENAVERYVSDIRSLLRDNKVRYLTIVADNGRVEIKFRDAAEREKGNQVIHDEYRDLVLNEAMKDGTPYLYASLSEKEQQATKKFAVKQNITTLRKRVNELGVAEPVIQQQGEGRIVVQLPGVQDTARAKDVIGATATLEYHMVDEEHDVRDAMNGRVPFGSRLYKQRNGQPILLEKRVIVTGDQIIDAQSGIDKQSGGPEVSVTLDSKGARKMLDNTRENVGKRMAVVYIETKTETKMVNGKPKRETKRIEEVISVATIRGVFSKRFQTTGLDSVEEAHNLALLLRAGALAAPMEIVEERTIGPSMGKENIDKGQLSVIVGFVVVLVFMAMWYKGFGMVANLALGLNLVFIVAVLSLLQATLTLPGIAGIVLTVGMAVDANVLIFERIREELRAGNTPHAAIHAGYEKAFSTIADANITTLIAAVVLFSFGTGPIKGFAITLSIGIITSMFTAIMVTRAVINLILGGKRLSKLSI